MLDKGSRARAQVSEIGGSGRNGGGSMRICALAAEPVAAASPISRKQHGKSRLALATPFTGENGTELLQSTSSCSMPELRDGCKTVDECSRRTDLQR